MIACNAERETEMMIFLSSTQPMFILNIVIPSGSIRSRKYVYNKFTYVRVIELDRPSYTCFYTWDEELG